MGVLITPMALAHPYHSIKGRSRNKRRNMWVGWWVSFWRPWYWPVHSIYHIHTTYYSSILTNQNKLFLGDMHAKSWYGRVGALDDLILSGFVCVFSCMVRYSLYHGMGTGTCDIVHWSAAPHHRIAYWNEFGMCIVLVLNVIRCSGHYFLDRIIFHHDFHHDICDYHWDFISLNYLLIYTLGFLHISSPGSANAQLPVWFHPWTFLNIGLNMFALESFMSCLRSLLGYSTGEFQALQQTVFAVFGAMDQPLAAYMLVYFFFKW